MPLAARIIIISSVTLLCAGATYLMLARESTRPLTATEKGWLRALEAWYDTRLANER